MYNCESPDIDYIIFYFLSLVLLLLLYIRMQNQWQSSTSGIKNKPAPIPISFSIPAGYAATTSGGPILLDRYTVRFPFNPPLIIPENCSCALTQASFAYSQPNIVGAFTLQSAPNGNNRITIDFGAGFVDIVLDPGLYDFTDVQTALNIWVRTHDINGGDAPPGTAIVTGTTDLFILTGISSTQKIIFSLNPNAFSPAGFPVGGITVNFENPSPTADPAHASDSIGPVLGYGTDAMGTTKFEFTTPSGATTEIFSDYAPNVAGFSDTSAYTLYMSIVTNSYQNGSSGQLLYSFPLGNYTPNSVVGYQATLRFPVQLISGTFSAIDVWTADQTGNKLPWDLYQAPFQFSAIISKNKEDGSI